MMTWYSFKKEQFDNMSIQLFPSAVGVCYQVAMLQGIFGHIIFVVGIGRATVTRVLNRYSTFTDNEVVDLQ